jgi:hypothetical protein
MLLIQIYYNNISINDYKKFSLSQILKSKHITEASSGETAHLKKVQIDKFVLLLFTFVTQNIIFPFLEYKIYI